MCVIFSILSCVFPLVFEILSFSWVLHTVLCDGGKPEASFANIFIGNNFSITLFDLCNKRYFSNFIIIYAHISICTYIYHKKSKKNGVLQTGFSESWVVLSFQTSLEVFTHIRQSSKHRSCFLSIPDIGIPCILGLAFLKFTFFSFEWNNQKLFPLNLEKIILHVFFMSEQKLISVFEFCKSKNTL